MANPAKAAALINQPDVASSPVADSKVTAPRNSARFHCPKRLRSKPRKRIGCSDIGALLAVFRLAKRDHPISPIQPVQIMADQQQGAPPTEAFE